MQAIQQNAEVRQDTTRACEHSQRLIQRLRLAISKSVLRPANVRVDRGLPLIEIEWIFQVGDRLMDLKAPLPDRFSHFRRLPIQVWLVPAASMRTAATLWDIPCLSLDRTIRLIPSIFFSPKHYERVERELRSKLGYRETDERDAGVFRLNWIDRLRR